MFEEIVVADPVKVASELENLKLDLEKLADVAKYAHSEGLPCTANDPKGYRLITVNAKLAAHPRASKS